MACVLLTSAALLACDTILIAETQITVRTDADSDLQQELTLLRVAVSLREVEGWRTPVVAEVEKAELRWPVDVPVTPRSSSDDSKQFEVVVEAVSNGRVLAQARALPRFSAGKRQVLELWLRRCPEAPSGYCAPPGCRGEACKTCNAQGMCGPVETIHPDSLPPLISTNMDAGAEDAGSFDGSAGDAESPEAVADGAGVDAASTSDAKVDVGSALDAASGASDGATRADAEPGVADVGTVDICSTCSTGWTCSPSGTRCVRLDLGKGDGSDVITLGDSWMMFVNTGIQVGLSKAAMQPYRNYAVPGTGVLSGQIPRQFDSAKSQDPDIKTVVMTGGMNDVLIDGSIGDCATGGPNCAARLDMLEKALDAMWKRMSESGVMDVVHVMYSKTMTDKTPVKDLPAHNARARQLCASHAPMRCFQVNTDALALTLQADGIHPTEAECDAIGRAIFVLMGQEGLRR